MELRSSPLDDRHRELGANLTDFGGWHMPLDYGSVVAEHRSVREAVGAFDLSHLGTLRVTGSGAEAAAQRAFTNDVTALRPGRAHYTLCLTSDGGIVDDLLVYRLAWGLFVVPNAANSAQVQAALQEVAGDDCQIADVKDDLACIAVQGPGSADAVTAAGVDVGQLRYLDCEVLAMPAPGGSASGSADAGAPPEAGVLARSGYTGEHGYELFVPVETAPSLWDRIVEGGAAPAGLGARDTLRLEMGYPLHGNDIDPSTSPVDAGLGWAVKPGTGFRGEAAYTARRESGPQRRLRGLKVSGRGIPRAHCAVLREGTAVGETTSGTFSPTLRLGVALAYLDPSVGLGETVTIEVRGRAIAAEVVRPPFVDADPKA
ncbi:MAG: glycine cleavage system aminomethyltransferase GcvT [Actinomycetota bacterium]|jgi:aminomethyltransferase|nr:glycine cleavage system aminomethyltransferase GcvT [Euzebyales bacterium]MDQ3383165.1 glycine cleavage system aminomethyltransferase GcvT [Actinomycetota bacterium]MDQ3530137.1 glycine cleavage system aminomethyltransferase GcvT [Actinomycetota bacterium]